MNMLRIGPLALAADRLLSVAALWTFIALISYDRK